MRPFGALAFSLVLASAAIGCSSGTANVPAPAPPHLTCGVAGSQNLTGLLTTVPLPASGGITGTITFPAVVGGLSSPLGLTISPTTAAQARAPQNASRNAQSSPIASWRLTFSGPAQQVSLIYPPSIALLLLPGIPPSSLVAQIVTESSPGAPAVLQPQGSGRNVTFTSGGSSFSVGLCGSYDILIVNAAQTNPSPTPSPVVTSAPTAAPTASPAPTAPPTPPPPANVYVADCGAICGGVGATTVTAYDALGNLIALSGTFPGIKGANGITYASSVGRLYVADCGTCYGTGATTVLAFTLSGAAVPLAGGAFAGLQQPNVLYVPANNQLYVPDYRQNRVFVYDLSGNAIATSGSFPGLNGPYGIAYVPDNNLIYVANFNVNSISTFDLQGNRSAVTFTTLSGPAGIAYAPDVHLLYVTDQNSNAVTAYDINGNRQTLPGTFPGLSGPGGIAYNPDSNLLYVTNTTGTVNVYNLDGTLNPIGSWSGASVPVGITIAP